MMLYNFRKTCQYLQLICSRNYFKQYGRRGAQISKSAMEDKLARTMEKVLNRRVIKEAQKDSFERPLSKAYKAPSFNEVSTKMKARNKLYMEHITEIMGSGELGQLNEDVAFDITKVEIAPNTEYLYVSWLPSNDIEDMDKVQEHLNKLSPKLRHELQSQRLLGYVPVIRFIRDTELFPLKELEKALAKADFGPDFHPQTERSSLFPLSVMPTEQNPSKPNETLIAPPEMRQDVLDLNHGHLMSQVRAATKRNPNRVVRTSDSADEFDTERRKDFNLFLRKKKYKAKEVQANTVYNYDTVKVELVDGEIENNYVEDEWEDDGEHLQKGNKNE